LCQMLQRRAGLGLDDQEESRETFINPRPTVHFLLLPSTRTCLPIRFYERKEPVLSTPFTHTQNGTIRLRPGPTAPLLG